MFLNGSQFQESGRSWFLTMYLCVFDLTGIVKRLWFCVMDCVSST